MQAGFDESAVASKKTRRQEQEAVIILRPKRQLTIEWTPDSGLLDSRVFHYLGVTLENSGRLFRIGL